LRPRHLQQHHHRPRRLHHRQHTDQIQTGFTALGANTSPLGKPGGEYPIACGWAQNHDQGTIYDASNTGPTRTRYQQLGRPAGRLGSPTTGENTTADDIGRYNHFSATAGAPIYWAMNTAAAHSIRGPLRVDRQHRHTPPRLPTRHHQPEQQQRSSHRHLLTLLGTSALEACSRSRPRDALGPAENDRVHG
jgi:uncharacterized protein with LGFP repeats